MKLPEDYTDEDFINAARSVHQRYGEIEIDDDATVSRGGDDGVYVQAWVWVDAAYLPNKEKPMLLKPPFFITSTLSPGLKIGDSTLHLADVQPAEEGRDRATFLLVTPEFEYVDDQMRSGVGGFRGTVGIFESFLGFMQAAVEAAEYEMRTGLESDNSDLFPKHIVEWALEHKDAIDMAICDITDEDGAPNESLIE